MAPEVVVITKRNFRYDGRTRRRREIVAVPRSVAVHLLESKKATIISGVRPMGLGTMGLVEWASDSEPSLTPAAG